MSVVITPFDNMSKKLWAYKGQTIAFEHFLHKTLLQYCNIAPMSSMQELSLWLSITGNLKLAIEYQQTFKLEQEYLIQAKPSSTYGLAKQKFLQIKPGLATCEITNYLSAHLVSFDTSVIFCNFFDANPSVLALIKKLKTITKVTCIFSYNPKNKNIEYKKYPNATDECHDTIAKIKALSGVTTHALVAPNQTYVTYLQQFLSIYELEYSDESRQNLAWFDYIKLVIKCLSMPIEPKECREILASKFTRIANKQTLLSLIDSNVPIQELGLDLIDKYPSSLQEHFLHRLKVFNFDTKSQQVLPLYQKLQALIYQIDTYSHIAFTLKLELLSHCITKTHIPTPINGDDIHITSLLNMHACNYDYIWFLGMDNLSYPLVKAPKHHLEKHLLPVYTVLQQDRLTKEQIKATIANNQNLTVSYSAIQKDQVVSSYINAKFNSKELTKPLVNFNDIKEQPICYEDVTGGTSAIVAANKCPFMAFGRYRLKIDNAPVSLGLHGPTKGLVLHKILEQFWRITKTNKNLDLDNAKTLINRLVKENLHQIQTQFSAEKQVLQDNIQNTLAEYLEFEQSQPSFVIKELEAQKCLTIDGYNLKLRVDRIDTTDTATRVIDYKTSLKSADELQLYIYLLAVPESIGGAFLQLKTQNICLKGIGQYSINNSLRDITTFKQEVYAKVKDALYVYLTKTNVVPGQYCDYCNLEPLCRKYER